MKGPVAQRQLESKRVGAGCDRQEPTTRVLPDTSSVSPRRPTKHTLEPCEGQASWLGGTQEIWKLLEQQCLIFKRGGHLSSAGSRPRCQGYTSSVTLIVTLCVIFLGFQTSPGPKHLGSPSRLHPAQHSPHLGFPGSRAQTSLPGGEGWKCRDKVTARFQFTLHLHPGTALGPAFAFLGLRFLTRGTGTLGSRTHKELLRSPK